MPLSQAKIRELKKEHRRRQENPRPKSTEVSQKLIVKNSVQRSFTDRYPREMLMLEKQLYVAYREYPSIDDRAIARALAAEIREQQTNTPEEAHVVLQLRDYREDSELSDENWINALRIIYTSVDNHRSRQPGTRNYLNFIEGFLRKTRTI